MRDIVQLVESCNQVGICQCEKNIERSSVSVKGGGTYAEGDIQLKKLLQLG